MVGEFLKQFLLLAQQMAPYLLLGFLVAGLLHVFIPQRWIFAQLGQRSAWSVIKGALLGAPLPLCSCGVLPVAASLRKSGASPPAVLSFLIATPVTGVDSILATYALMGGFLAVVRPVASVVLAIAAGLALLAFGGGPAESPPGDKQGNVEVGTAPRLVSRLVDAVRYALFDLFAGIAGPMLVGLAAGAAIAVFVPADLVMRLGVTGVAAYILMVAIGAPLYVCATGSIPIAAALLSKGLSPGAALAFLLAGPATNTVAIAVSRTLVGRKGTVIYLACIVLGSVLAAAGTDALATLIGYSWDASAGHRHHGEEGPGLFFQVCGFFLLGLSAWHLAAPRITAWKLSRRQSQPSAATVMLSVPKASCKRCAATISGALTSDPSVLSVHVDLQTKLVKVDLGGRVDVDRLVEILARAGYAASQAPGTPGPGSSGSR